MDAHLLKTRLIEQAEQKSIVLSATVELTNYCNFKCPHCYICSEEEKTFLDFDLYKNFLREFKNQGGVYLTLTGGEAILHPSFDQFYITAKKLGFVITVFSNGFYIDTKIDLFRKYRPYEIDITLYGIDEATYEENTGRKGGQNVFQNMKLLKENNIIFSLKACVTTYIKPLLEDMRRIADEYGTTFRFDPYIIGNVFEKQSIANFRLPPEDIASTLLSDRRMVDTIQQGLDNSIHSEKLYQCEPAKNSIFLNSHGKMMICPFSMYALSFDMAKGSFLEGIQYLRNMGCFKKTQQMKCASCKLSKICKYCPERFLLETGNPFTPPGWMCQVAELLKEQCPQKSNCNPID